MTGSTQSHLMRSRSPSRLLFGSGFTFVALVDRIYRTRENRGLSREHGITMCGRLGLSVFVANLFGIPATGFFVLYFLELPESPGKWHLNEFFNTMG